MLDCFPVGIFNDCFGIRRAFCHPHDEADHLSVKEAIFLVVQHSCEDSQIFGFPADFFEKLDEIGVGVGLIFFRFSGDDIDREESIWLTVEQLLVFLYKVINIFMVLAVAYTGTYNDFVERVKIKSVGTVNGVNLYRSTFFLNPFLNML